MTELEKKHYRPQTLCELCDNACGGCSWSEYGVQQPVKGWDAIRVDLMYNNQVYSGFRKIFFSESYIVLSCPQFKLEERSAWAFANFDPEKIRRRAFSGKYPRQSDVKEIVLQSNTGKAVENGEGH